MYYVEITSSCHVMSCHVMIVRLLLQIIILVSGYGIVLGLPIRESYSSSDCCSLISSDAALRTDTLNLIACVNGSSSMVQPLQRTILTFVMFASSEIYQYASHAVLVNALYFERQGYSARLLGVETGDDFYPTDRRWNKIPSIMKALDPKGGWAAEQEAIVFVDTDLVVLDWSLDPSEALQRHPDADLLLSADALDVGNTGFLIIRNTAWAREFFQKWWDARYLMGTFCDQHVLNKLYSTLKKEGHGQKIAILAANAVNSRWPAMETLDSSDRVLHLMGEVNPYRTAVARYASQTVCKARDQALLTLNPDTLENVECFNSVTAYDLEKELPVQLGFTQDLLVSLARAAFAEERELLFSLCASGLAGEADFDRLHEVITNSCDDKRPYLSSTPLQCEDLLLKEYRLSSLALEPTSHQPQPKQGRDQEDLQLQSSFNVSSTFRLYLADHMTKVLYDVLYFTPKTRKRHAADRMLASLEVLSGYVDMRQDENKRYISHKRGLLHAQLSTYYMLQSEWHDALADGIKAIDELSQVMSLTTEDNADFSGFTLEYIDSSSKISEILIHLSAFQDALEWAHTALHNAETLFRTYRGEERVMAQELARLHLLVADAALLAGLTKESREQLTLARLSKLSFDIEDNLSAELKHKEQSIIKRLQSAEAHVPTPYVRQ